MIKKYYSSYTGKQIDEAVKTIVENEIKLEDLSQELIAEIKKWIAEGGSSGVEELHFSTHFDFPNVGEANKLYIATDEDKVYYWKESHYVALATSEMEDIAEINCGGANNND